MLAPILIVAAVGLLPLPRQTRYLMLAVTVLCRCLVAARSDFLERAPVGDPYVQVGAAAHRRTPTQHGADDRRRADGLHRHRPAAADSRAADRRLDGAAARRHPD